MGNDTYSVQALVVDSGKNVKGILTLSIDKYEFNGAQTFINWETASIKRGTSIIRNFIFKSKKPYVIIHEGEKNSSKFILEATQIEELVDKISKFKGKVRNRRIAEEENKRYEEKRKPCEEEHTSKLEEECKIQETLAKKIENRKARIVLEVADARNSAQSVPTSWCVESSFKKAWAYFINNPYRILGVSVTATSEESHSSLEKIKKLTRLDAVASFKSNYELNGIEKPARDLSIVQNAFSEIKDQKYKWFWFATQDAGIAWQSENYRKELTYDGMEFGSYDLFLANYIYALIFDPGFEKASLWRPVFTYYIYICNDSSQKLIRSRFNDKELSEINMSDAIRSFKAEIFKPIEELCEIQDAKTILCLYKILYEFSDASINDFIKTVMTQLTRWFTLKEEVICTLVNKCNDDNRISFSEAWEIEKAGDTYIQEVDKVLCDALAAVQNVTVRYEMIKESYRNATWLLMFAFQKAFDMDNAIFYAKKCYPYCDESDRQKIINAFGFSVIKSVEQNVPYAEWDTLGDNYYEGKNGYKQDYFEAFKWYKKAAEAGNKYSQNSLGICYQEGNGIYRSYYEAADWFKKAYENGNADGAINLAKCYASGNGRRQDNYMAMFLYLEATKLGERFMN